MAEQTIRYSNDTTICVVDDGKGNLRVPSPREMSSLPIGDDLSQEEVESLDE